MHLSEDLLIPVKQVQPPTLLWDSLWVTSVPSFQPFSLL
jgi:hypothetical protein